MLDTRQKNRLRWTALDFWAKVDIKGRDECWPWLGGTYAGSNGYGRAWDGRIGKNRSAHVIAYELETGKSIKRPYIGLHTCDNPPCCNPRHVKKGTHQDNSNDMVEKGRPHGCPFKASVTRVKALRKKHPDWTIGKLAKQVGVHRTTIHNYLNR